MDNIKVWIAKDKNAVRCRLFANKPTRLNDCWVDGQCSHEPSFSLFSTMYPNQKWEDEPIQVELNEVRTEQVKEMQEFVRKYYNYWL